MPDSLFLILFPIIFIGFWCFVIYLISRFGWSKLAERYETSGTPEGVRFSMESLRLGFFAHYNSCLTVIVNKEGLFLRPWLIFRLGHQSLLIPWDQLRNPKRQSFLFYKVVTFDIAEPGFAKITLSQKIILASPLAETLRQAL